MKAILKATGLESDSDDAAGPAAEVEQPQQARKRQKRLQPLPVSEDRLPSLEDADHIDGRDGEEQPKSQEPFDYSAAHASAPGLKLDFNPAPVRGRGGSPSPALGFDPRVSKSNQRGACLAGHKAAQHSTTSIEDCQRACILKLG